MKLPFTPDQFLAVFERYNTAVWPMQVMLVMLAAIAISLVLIRKSYSGKAIVNILTFFWFWMGLVYHIFYFTSINQAAFIFGSLFIVQGLLFIWSGIIKNHLAFTLKAGLKETTGLLMILYALVIYPILGNFLGHAYPQSPTFGAPCPTTIFTFGILLLCYRRIPLYLVIIPVLWSFLGLSAAMKLHIYEDFGLIISGLAALILIIFHNKRLQKLSVP